MRPLIITAFISVDGVMEAPGGEDGYRNSGWTFQDIEFVPEAYEIKGSAGSPAFVKQRGLVVTDPFRTLALDAIKRDRLLVPTALGAMAPPTEELRVPATLAP